jgi:hypothetical protein
MSETLANFIKLSTQQRGERKNKEIGPKRTQVPAIKAKPKVGHKGANEQFGFQSPHQWQGYIKNERDGKFETTCLKIEVA